LGNITYDKYLYRDQERQYRTKLSQETLYLELYDTVIHLQNQKKKGGKRKSEISSPLQEGKISEALLLWEEEKGKNF